MKKIVRTRKNPFRIPGLTRKHQAAVKCLHQMYDAVVDLVRQSQGAKGYIDTQDTDHTTIYAYVYDYDAFEAREMRVHGVRVNADNGDLEIIFDTDNTPRRMSITYGDEDFRSHDADWRSVRYDESVFYVQTIFNIAECIPEYID